MDKVIITWSNITPFFKAKKYFWNPTFPFLYKIAHSFLQSQPTFVLYVNKNIKKCILALNDIFWVLDQRSLFFIKILLILHFIDFISIIGLEWIKSLKFVVYPRQEKWFTIKKNLINWICKVLWQRWCW